MKTTRHDPLLCPKCKTDLDCSTCVTSDSDSPSPGDLAMCFYCKSVLCFGQGLDLSIASEEDLNSMSEEEKLALQLVRSIREVVKNNPESS